MPHKGAPIRYRQKQSVRNRQQSAGEKFVSANLKIILR